MTVYIVEALLWILVAGLGLAAAVKGRILFREGAREGITDFLRLLPKVLLGVVGSGPTRDFSALALRFWQVLSRRADLWWVFPSAPLPSRAARAHRR